MNLDVGRKTLTSESSPLRLDRVVPENRAGGWVALTIAPGKKTAGMFAQWDRDLEADLTAILDAHATLLVPLIEGDEMRRFQIRDLPERATARGLLVERFPFHDGGIPQSLSATADFIDALARKYRAGARMVIHCAGGLGRAGTIGACLRLRLGLDGTSDAAIGSIRQLRSPRAIETAAQERFIEQYVERIHGG